ncbi:hypothetical protein FJTKL_06975 [Diaporthe vaccinii]|uniref:Uncharacterized protein n=1 Tax=Diaporthe vaccinii TaxID=105482 RepID=A0ABR4DQD6_9PEZI
MVVGAFVDGSVPPSNIIEGQGPLLKLVPTAPAYHGVSSASTGVGNQEVAPLLSQQSRPHLWVFSSLVAGVERDMCCVNRSHQSPYWCSHPRNVGQRCQSVDVNGQDPELERLINDYTFIDQEGVAQFNEPTPEEMSPKTAESIRAVRDCSFVGEDSIQADPEGSQLALPDAPGQTKPQGKEGRVVGKGRQRRKVDEGTPNAETRSKKARRKVEETPTVSNKKMAIERGETVADLTQPYLEPVQPLSPSTASHPDEGRLSVPQDDTQHDVDDDILDRLDVEGSLGDVLINHSLKQLADMFPLCQLKKSHSSLHPDPYLHRASRCCG